MPRLDPSQHSGHLRVPLHPPAQSRLAAMRLEALGAHHLAQPYYARVVAAMQAHAMPDGVGLLAALHDLACCRFNGGCHAQALSDFQQMRDLLRVTNSPTGFALPWIHDQILRCEKALRDRANVATVQHYVGAMLKRARSQQLSGESDRQERLRLLARGLFARGHTVAGARLMASWLDQIMASQPPESDEALVDIREHAQALWIAGDLGHAAHALRAVVVMLNRRQGGRRNPAAIAQALQDWEACNCVARGRAPLT